MSKIFFSYAWAKEGEIDENRETIVNHLYDSLKNDGYDLVRDKPDLGYKGFISEFMQEIGKADKVIVVISDKYVRSPFCMFELYEIARNSKFEKQLFRERVSPIMYEFVDFTRPEIIDKYAAYWEDENRAWESLFQKRMGQLSIEQFSRYDKTKLIWQNLGRLMDWLVDMNTLNPKMLSENNFGIIKKALGESRQSQIRPTSINAENQIHANNVLSEFKTQRLATLQNQLGILRKLKDSYEQKLILADDPKIIMKYELEVNGIDVQMNKIVNEMNNITE